jgi:phosphate transport system substrate-binding protein
MLKLYAHRISGWIAVTLLFAVLLFPMSISAQQIVLQAKTGTVRVEGKLLNFDGEFYQVETGFGVLTIDGRTVTCAGDACPGVQDMVSRFTVLGSDALGRVLIPVLLQSFAGSQGYTVTISDMSPEGQTMSITDTSGQPIAVIRIETQPEKTAFEALSKGGNIIVAASRRANADEIAASIAAGQGNPTETEYQQVLAVDGVVAAVSQVNPLGSLRMTDLARILRGDVTNWRTIGGPDADIAVYVARDNPAFSTILENSSLGVNMSQITPKAMMVETLAEASDKVAGDPFGLALTSYSNLRNARALGLRGACGIYSIPAGFTLKSGGYPLVFKHYLYKPKTRLPIFAREFLEFAQSDQAQNLLRNLGYGDLGVTSLPVNVQGLRLINSIAQAGKEVPLAKIQQLMQLQNGAERLSATFRFKPDSKALNGPSRQNITALVAGLMLGNYADKQIHLIGFSDAAGESEQNIKRSRQRAELVREALKAAAPEGNLDDAVFKVSGFGEAAPLACEDTLVGKNINRRVEVWIKDP